MRERVFRTTLSRAVKAAREERGFTQRRLAEKAGIGFKYLSRIELGQTTPSALVTLKLASALGITLDDLVATTPSAVSPMLLAIARLLRDQSEKDLDRARRILVELFR
jgi:transcriptional regulator with XRE-family HTH domain